MESGIIASLISIGALVVINIAAVAFSYGKLSQKVSDICKRIDKVDQRLNHLADKIEQLTLEVVALKARTP